MSISDTQQAAQFSADAAVSAAEAKQYLLEAQQGYQDTSEAAQEAKNAAESASSSEQNAATSEANALQSATEASAARDEAVVAASTAAEFGDNKFTFYKTSSDPDGTIAGLAATTNGQSFRVAEGPEATAAFKTYENQDGVAVLQASQPGTAAITGTIREFPTLTAAQADADAGNIPVGSTAYYRTANDDTLAIEVVNVDGTLQPTGRRLIRDDYGYQVSPDSVALAGYDPETKRVAPFLNTDGRLIQIGPDGKYYELLTPQEAELYALGSEGKVTQFIGGEKV
ncbi:TPA: SGNH/GDSL hydrolase family protein, partial [Klebsiella pneumoniae]